MPRLWLSLRSRQILERTKVTHSVVTTEVHEYFGGNNLIGVGTHCYEARWRAANAIDTCSDCDIELREVKG